MDTSSKYLLSSLLGAANTANAYRPVARRSGPLTIPAFFTAWPTSELPLHLIGWQALATAGFAARGGLKGARGKAGLAVSAASWAALAYLHVEARRAEGVLEQALIDELGADYRSRIQPSLQASPDVPLTVDRVIRPLASRRHRTEVGVPYADGGKRNLLDIWRRNDLPRDGKAPVLFQVHGGAWMVGAKEEQANPLMHHLADRGWVCVAINYRLSPKHSWPAHIVDVKRALAWTREHIAGYGGDPDFIAITGGSAGGHLTALTALTPNDPEFQPGFEGIDTTVQAAVPFYGVYDFVNRDGTGRSDMIEFLERAVFKTRFEDGIDVWDKASPMSHVGPQAPPMFLLHGANDSLVPVEQARSFVDLLRKESTLPVAYAELPRAQHAWDIFASPRTHYTVHAVERFLNFVRSQV